MSDSGTVRARKNVSVVREPAFRLHVQAGPDVGSVFVLEGTQAPRMLLGTSPACDFRLTDRLVSRRHLSLELADGCVRVTELGSTNGTTSRGVRIREVFLRGGETLELGSTVIHASVDEDAGRPLVSDEAAFGRFLGQSVAIRRLYPICQRLAASPLPIVVEGETGTGKELMAEALHEMGPTAGGAFVVLDASTLVAENSQSVLAAALEEAAAGTIVLDEVGELELGVQARVLRLVERAAGGGPRIIATSRRDLDKEVSDGRFREELYFRLAVGRLELPPLRRRPEDVGVLARHFWRRLGATTELPASALARFDAYHWPGNVRELQNAVARLFTVGEEQATAREYPPITAAAPDFIGQVIAAGLPLTTARQKVVDEFERRYVHDAFMKNGQNVTKAAAAAGIARRYFRVLRARRRDEGKARLYGFMSEQAS
jgi:two-component system, NtrC family, response regulator HydG